MECIYTHTGYAKFGNLVLDSFYFQLALNDRYKKALLGADFISCCKFIGDVKDDIVVTDFDKGVYKEYTDIVPAEDVLEFDSLDFSDLLPKPAQIKYTSKFKDLNAF